MPSVAQETPTVSSCKKRRRDDEDGYTGSHSGTSHVSLHADGFSRSATPNSNLHIANPALPLHNDHHLNSSLDVLSLLSEKAFDHGSVFHQHHSSSPVRRIIPFPITKRQRVASDDDRPSPQRQPQHQTTTAKLLQEKSANSRPTTPSRSANASSANLMTRCHICFRKPAKKSDLDSFADCQRCGQRTCYVCIRQCLGWRPDLMVGQQPGDILLGETGLGGQGENSDSSFTMLDADDASDMGHDDGNNRHTNYQVRNHKPQGTNGWAGDGHWRVVCSQCCVEKGPDGDVVCLGCLPFFEG